MVSPPYVADTDGLAGNMAATKISDSGVVQLTSSWVLDSSGEADAVVALRRLSGNSSKKSTIGDLDDPGGNGQIRDALDDEFSDADGSDGECNEEGYTCGLDLQTAVPKLPMVEYYNDIAWFYARSPDQIARATWMKNLIEKQKSWIGLDRAMVDIKALDYAAGTGFLSLALAPHVNDIIAIDAARNMIDEYNEMAAETKQAHSDCAMQAVCGSLVKLLDGQGKTNETFHLDRNFNLIAMCLAVDFFALDKDSDALQAALFTLARYLKDGGTILILEIEKNYVPHEARDDDVYFEKLRNGRKCVGHGSREVAAALEALGMENISITGDLKFRAEISLFGTPFVREEIYFMVKATKGANLHARADKDDSEGVL